MKEILIATTNQGKVADFKTLLTPLGIKVKSLLEYEDIIEVEETGATFTENAILKAEAISKQFNTNVIADDSGLAIDALQGRPGVYSARYAGIEKNDRANMAKVLEELEGIPTNKRTARFHCVLALAIPNDETKTVEGTCEGIIATSPIGDQGFGYDPVFFLPELGKTMAQLSKEDKNQISHRAKAFKKLMGLLESVNNEEESSL
ncbi:XTP/dITP diphosphatase [Cytobacillus suaedae]|nr:XTP/dITP diphosphatase [Cytobacillus suaedae]